MKNKSLFDDIFNDLITGNFPKDKMVSLKSNLNLDDFEWIISFIENLNDPSDYFSGNEKRDENAISGFFLSIDLASALIISLGEKAFDKLDLYKNSKNRYISWVFKYVDDDRFYKDLKTKFDFIL